ncbi:MAG: hypothetical protein M1832_001082 [Thelocarpon impressellum]|nr:MAG: hypothetical protein M1832_001082 [Thelocarpon impressellum]
MAATRPTLVFVHGAWHSPAAWAPLRELLAAAGHKSVALQLPSSARTAPPHPQTYESDVSAVQAAVLNVLDAGEEAVVVMHSYGGVVGGEAVKGLDAASRGAGKTAVKGLLYIAAAALQPGQDILGAQLPSRADEEFASRIRVEDGIVTILDAAYLFYNDLSPEASAHYASLLHPQAMATITQPATYAAFRDFESSYLLCTRDNALPLAFQRQMVRDAGAGAFALVDVVEAGHSPFLSQPGAVAAFIERALGAGAG